MTHPWIAQRTSAFESSGIRRVFDLAAKLENPINFSIGQPDFEVPPEVRRACCDAIEAGRNGYSQTQGIGPLLERLQADLDAEYGHGDRGVFVCSGTSGGLVLAMMAMIDPGDEVIYFDPYFVMYPSLIELAGGVPKPISTYPDFRLDPQKIADAITPRTKMIIVNSPANPTGVVASDDELRAVAELAERHGVALVSDEIYSRFQFDTPFVSPARFNPQTIVVDGFSKSHAMTGWRVGFVHGPRPLIDAMAKLQQYTFVCAPQPAQWAALRALDVDLAEHRDHYRRKRDRIVDALADLYPIVKPAGAFYVFPRVPPGSGREETATQFVERAIEQGLLVIPGKIFSSRDTHFRISYATSDEMIERGIELLRQLAAPPH
jgi:aspartate aminotransferase/aminotransferase